MKRTLLTLVLGSILLSAAPAAAQQWCRTSSGVEVLCSTVGAAAIQACEDAVAAADLSAITNLTEHTGCKDDTPCTARRVGRHVADEEGLAQDFVLAVLWTESRWNQWKDDGTVLIGGGVDYGHGQINITTWQSRYDWPQIEGDILYNTRAAGAILAWSYSYAKRKTSYTGEDLFRAAYAVYNAGPRGVTRPFTQNDPRDANFLAHYRAKPWLNIIGGCP